MILIIFKLNGTKSAFRGRAALNVVCFTEKTCPVSTVIQNVIPLLLTIGYIVIYFYLKRIILPYPFLVFPPQTTLIVNFAVVP